MFYFIRDSFLSNLGYISSQFLLTRYFYQLNQKHIIYVYFFFAGDIDRHLRFK